MEEINCCGFFFLTFLIVTVVSYKHTLKRITPLNTQSTRKYNLFYLYLLFLTCVILQYYTVQDYSVYTRRTLGMSFNSRIEWRESYMTVRSHYVIVTGLSCLWFGPMMIDVTFTITNQRNRSWNWQSFGFGRCLNFTGVKLSLDTGCHRKCIN